MFSRNKLHYNSNLIDFKDEQSATDGSGKKPNKNYNFILASVLLVINIGRISYHV